VRSLAIVGRDDGCEWSGQGSREESVEMPGRDVAGLIAERDQAGPGTHGDNAAKKRQLWMSTGMVLSHGSRSSHETNG
jgi:hypothetical protein